MNLVIGCKECSSRVAGDAWELFKGTRGFDCLVDESHFSIRLREGAYCKQNYLSVFAEAIDWKDGEDPQLWSIIPVDAEEISELKGYENEQLLVNAVKGFSPERRSLCLGWPKRG